MAELIILGKLITKSEEPDPPSGRARQCGRRVSDFLWPSEEGAMAAVSLPPYTQTEVFVHNQWGAERGLGLDLYHTASVCIHHSPRDSCWVWPLPAMPIAPSHVRSDLGEIQKKKPKLNFTTHFDTPKILDIIISQVSSIKAINNIFCTLLFENTNSSTSSVCYTYTHSHITWPMTAATLDQEALDHGKVSIEGHDGPWDPVAVNTGINPSVLTVKRLVKSLDGRGGKIFQWVKLFHNSK